MPLVDTFNRKIDYLRVSITDRCNLRCNYCMPPNGLEWLPRNEVLTYEELVRIVQAAVTAGIRKVRISGGEPLLRRNVSEFVAKLAAIDGLEDLSLTTNGLLLAELASSLKQAGLQRINISLDSLNPSRYTQLTGGGDLQEVWQGIEAAQAAGLNPIKVNVVVLAGINDDELLDFATLAKEHPWHIRFIELRPGSPLHQKAYLPISEVWQRINNVYPLKLVPTSVNTTARLYSFSGSKGILGFIGKAESDLCDNCNRLRLTASGQLYPCLFSNNSLDIKSIVQQQVSNDKLINCIKLAVAQKPHHLPPLTSPNSMSVMGG